jgi:hypothetical protein
MTPELERIRQRLIAGLAIRQVAREEGSGRGAVARGVQSDLGMDPRMLRQELYALAPDALKTVRLAIRNQKDPRPAYQLLRDLGAVPSRKERELAGTQAPSAEELFHQYKHRAAYQLGLVAMERNEVYGTELPISWDQLNQRMQKDLTGDKDRERRQSADPTPREEEGAKPEEDVPPIHE